MLIRSFPGNSTSSIFRTFFSAAAVILSVSAFNLGTAQANLLQNGGFEAPIATDNSFYVVFEAGPTTINSWTYYGLGGTMTPTAEFVGQPASVPEGSQYGFLQAYEGYQSTISQDVILAGGNYHLSYVDAGRIPPNVASGVVSYNILLIQGGNQTIIGSSTTIADGTFYAKSFDFAAAAGTATIEFVATNTSGDNTMFLDLVTLDAINVVPEPSTLGLISLGSLMGVGITFRRRKSI